MRSSEQDGLLLPGLDGTNPLGFLAALGLLRILSQNSDIRMCWRPWGSYYCPIVFLSYASDDKFLEQLMSTLDLQDKCVWLLDKKLPFGKEKFAEVCERKIDSSCTSERYSVDVLAGLGAMPKHETEDTFSDTDLRMVRSGDSAGNGLLAYAVKIQENTTKADLERALFTPWDWSDQDCALRWDPLENRAYALRWRNPSKEATLSVRGANRLALEALVCLPVIPTGQGAQTTGFASTGRARKAFTWFLWERLASCETICSMLRADIFEEDAVMLRERGIFSIHRCERIMTSQYYANFTPAQRIA